jgi:hypothetical protein
MSKWTPFPSACVGESPKARPGSANWRQGATGCHRAEPEHATQSDLHPFHPPGHIPRACGKWAYLNDWFDHRWDSHHDSKWPELVKKVRDFFEKVMAVSSYAGPDGWGETILGPADAAPDVARIAIRHSEIHREESDLANTTDAYDSGVSDTFDGSDSHWQHPRAYVPGYGDQALRYVNDGRGRFNNRN